MAKDRRYDIVKRLMNSGYIATFSEILEILPKTTIARDLKMHHVTFGKLIKDPDRFTVKHIGRLASLIGVDRLEFGKIILNSSKVKTGIKQKKSKKRIRSKS